MYNNILYYYSVVFCVTIVFYFYFTFNLNILESPADLNNKSNEV